MTTPTDRGDYSPGQPYNIPKEAPDTTWIQTEQVRSVPPWQREPQPTLPDPGVSEKPPPKRSWFARHKVLTGVGAAFLLFTGIGVAAGGGDGGGGTAASAPTAVVEPTMPPLSQEQKDANDAASKAPPAPPAATATAPPVTAKPKPPPPPAAPELTVSQQNAIGKAQDYLDTMYFSKSGLVEQLVFEDFSKADATFAVNHIKVDWNEQAAGKAKDYLGTMHFSRGGLIEQLEFDGFTRAQATYGVNQAGL